jgi:signal transduction histidine kinase
VAETKFLQGIRRNLTLWYTTVLAVALAVMGGLLYYGAHRELFTRPVVGAARGQAEFVARDWQLDPGTPCQARPTFTGPVPPPPPRPRVRVPVYLACLTVEGALIDALIIPSSDVGRPPDAFLTSTLVPEVLRSGEAEDRVEVEDLGPVYRFARIVPAPMGTGALGIVMVGRPIVEQTQALALLRNLLMLTAGLSILVALLGGLFLTQRALQPARLAFARQQEFIADASHELRTPLTLIRANAEVLLRQRGRLEPRDAALVDDIVAETAHVDRLTTSLLTLARLDANRFHFESDVVDLSAIASNALRRLRPQAVEKRLTVSEALAGEVIVLGDAEAIEQVALILLDNAIKYTPAGGTVAVRTTLTDGRAELVVQDSGIGIPAEDLPHLGERFYRVDKARSREAGGAGLGLAIAFRIADAHGGGVRLDSEPGKGTSAALSLKSARTAGPVMSDRRTGRPDG